MSLTSYLIEGLLPEEEKRQIAVYGGGFKPPTSGHFEVVKTALKKNPNIDKFPKTLKNKNNFRLLLFFELNIFMPQK